MLADQSRYSSSFTATNKTLTMATSVVLSLMVVTWTLTAARSFLRVSSVSQAHAMIHGRNISTKSLRSTQNQLEVILETYPLS
jgi:hypothetical protein